MKIAIVGSGYLVETTIETRKRAIARRIIQAVGGNVRGKTIAIFGLTFKPDTDAWRLCSNSSSYPRVAI